MIHPTGQNGEDVPKESQRTAVELALNSEVHDLSEMAHSDSRSCRRLIQ